MKKLFSIVFCAFMVSTSLSAQQLIPFTVNYDEKDIPIGNGYPKSPMRPPVVYIEDYTLTFVAGHPDYELTIKDEEGETIYTTFVTSAETLVTLPSTLTGDYVIELRMGYWLFTGWIEL